MLSVHLISGAFCSHGSMRWCVWCAGRTWISLLWWCARGRPDPNVNSQSHKHSECVRGTADHPALFVQFAAISFQPLVWTNCGCVCTFYGHSLAEEATREKITHTNPKVPVYVSINVSIWELLETTSGLKEFIKCCTILWLLVYRLYKQ